MKKHLLPIILFCATINISAQEYLHINSHWHGGYIPLELIDSITYGEASNNRMLPAIMAQDPNISIFNKALEITHMSDSLLGEYNYKFQEEDGKIYDGFQGNKVYGLPKIKKGYTAFAETDSVYAAHGINNIEDLKAYAARVYNEMYPEDASITDPTDRRNSLNRFVSYHLLDIKADKNNLTAANIISNVGKEIKAKYNRNMIDIADWYETMMPHSLIKCSSPLLSDDKERVFINRRGVGDKPVRNIFIEGAEIINTSDNALQGTALNGNYHYISDIIAYDKQTQEVVLDEQIIVNNTTMSPEFFNNDLRIHFPYSSIAAANNVYERGIYVPNMAMKNIRVYTPSTQIYYLFSDGWHDYQTDEMFITGGYDFDIKLPSLPAGTYELNIGYSGTRSTALLYFDEEFCDTIRFNSAEDWESDYRLETPEAIAKNDSLLHANGYRKGLEYYSHNTSGTSMRDYYLCLRRIITTFTTDGKSDHYLRFKNATESYLELHIDYIELTPTRLLKEYK